VALIEFNPPQKLVFMNRSLVTQISEELETLENNPEVNVIVLTGKDNSFAVGADINELNAAQLKDQLFADYFERLWYRIIPKIRKPLIAAVNGLCFGGGFEIALMCDIVVASENARFGLPEIKLGVIPGAGGTQRLPRLVGKSKAMEMILTGAPISAKEAKEWHIVTSVHSREKLVEETLNLAKKIAAQSQISAAFAKRAISQAYESSLQGGLDHERSLFIGLMGTADKKEGVKAFLEKRPAKFTN
jgi:enoyl-CoA hydratase